MSGADELFELAHDFGKAPAKVAAALFSSFKAEGEAFAEDWKANATATSGKAARQYPSKIDSETRVALGILVEIGPRAEGQGNLGRYLEFGSPTSSAHLDGARALPAAEARLEKTAAEAVESVLP